MTMPHEPRGGRIDSHPVRTASTRQIWWTVGGALLPGLILLAGAVQAGQPITAAVLGAAALAVLVPLAAAEKARRGTVRDAEAETTPWRDARDDRGQRLLSRRDSALQQLLDDRLVELGYQLEPSPPANAAPAGPSGTSVQTAVDPGRARRAADGPESKQPHERWAPAGPDYVGDRVRAYDEQAARDRGRDPGVRAGRAIANRADRRAAAAPARHVRGGRQ